MLFLIIIAVIILVLVLLVSKTENFTPCEKIAWELNFPKPIEFNFSDKPTTIINNCNFSRPWCVNKFGWPVPCPCPNLDPYIKEIGPTPVLNTSQGAYTPSKFTPGNGIY
jgi:hypothetical protein